MTQEDVSGLEGEGRREGFHGLDILLTAEWPRGVAKYSHPPVSHTHTHTHTHTHHSFTSVPGNHRRVWMWVRLEPFQ